MERTRRADVSAAVRRRQAPVKRRGVDGVVLQTSIESRSGNSEQLRCATAVSSGGTQGAPDRIDAEDMTVWLGRGSGRGRECERNR